VNFKNIKVTQAGKRDFSNIIPRGRLRKSDAFLRWYVKNKPFLSSEMQTHIEKSVSESRLAQARKETGLNGEMGDIWSNLKHELIDKVSGGVKELADKSTSVINNAAQNAPALAKAAAEYKIVKENIKRLDAGKPLINVADVGGFGDIKNTVLIGGAVVVGLLLMRGKK
jgi:hypothetical protein